MTRLIAISTITGLAGLILTMFAALTSGASLVALGMGFGMTALGLIGAVVGAAGQALQAAR